MNLNKILLTTAVLLLTGIIFSSAVLLTTNKAKPGAGLEKISQQSEQRSIFTPAVTPEKTTFTKLGQLRISSHPDKKGKTSVIIVTPILEYGAEDDVFYEELDSKTKLLRKMITAYFNAHTTDQLNAKGEDRIKEELMANINSTVVLQKIKKIYFKDYLLL